jgi:hypothetical protein
MGEEWYKQNATAEKQQYAISQISHIDIQYHADAISKKK